MIKILICGHLMISVVYRTEIIFIRTIVRTYDKIFVTMCIIDFSHQFLYVSFIYGTEFYLAQ